MGHVRRLAALLVSIIAVAMLVILLDGAVDPFIATAYDYGVDEGPFAPVLDFADSIRWVLVPGMLLGIVLWYVYGTVQEERREEEIRRVRRP